MSNTSTSTAAISAATSATFVAYGIGWDSKLDAAVNETEFELVTAEWTGIDVEGEMRVLELDAGAGRPLAYEKHKRGTNWVAVLTGKNAANMHRNSRSYQNGLFDYSGLAVGDAVEVGADYTTGGGNRYRVRYYFLVAHLDDEKMGFLEYGTAAQVMKAARIRRKNLEEIAAKAAKAAAFAPKAD